MESSSSKRAAKGDELGAPFSSSSSMMTNLPTHILMEILSRIPIKTIMALRCVCKSLLHIISDPHFARLQFARTPIELLLRPWHHEEVSTTLYMGDFQFFENDYLLDVKFNNVVFDLPRFSVRMNNAVNFKATSSKLYLVNSCNGLLCFCGPSTNRFAVIWNPVTREFITFPAPDKKDKSIHNWGTLYGFGFSPKTNQYKLLRLLSRVPTDSISGDTNVGRNVAEIYTFGEGSWKNIDIHSPIPRIYSPYRPTFLGGALHWLCFESYCDIASFDFDKEQFANVSAPPHYRKYEKPMETLHTTMGVLGGCLYISDNIGDRVDIWVMKEYGIQDSWIKAFSIVWPTLNNQKQRYEPIKHLDNGEILIFVSGVCLCIYNPIEKSFREIGRSFQCIEAITYHPTIGSLKNALIGDKLEVLTAKSRCAVWELREVAKYSRWWKASMDVIEELQRKRKMQEIEQEIEQLMQRGELRKQRLQQFREQWNRRQQQWREKYDQNEWKMEQQTIESQDTETLFKLSKEQRMEMKRDFEQIKEEIKRDSEQTDEELKRYLEQIVEMRFDLRQLFHP